MSDAVDNLKTWFNSLTSSQQKEVLEFLYGGTVLTTKGLYVGPDPNLVKRTLLWPTARSKLKQVPKLRPIILVNPCRHE